MGVWVVGMDGGGYEEDGLFKCKIMGLLAWQVWQYGVKSVYIEWEK